MEQMRWGVIGASARIYQGRLKPAFALADGHEIVAEASRSTAGGASSEAPYAELVRRADIDAVYIPLPNAGHKPWILRALEAGKHVLCEKPLTLSPADTDEVFAAATAAGRTVMEAYMWPHHPRARRILTMVTDGELGELRALRSVFTYPSSNPNDHRFDERGAGALFDVGIYCLGPAMMIAGRDPVGCAAAATRNAVGVDVAMTGFVDWGDGFASSFEVGMDAPHRRILEVSGTTGALTVPGQHAPGPEEPSDIVVQRRDDSVETTRVDGANAFAEMIKQFGAVVAELEHPVFGPTESKRLAHVIDALHRASPAAG